LTDSSLVYVLVTGRFLVSRKLSLILLGSCFPAFLFDRERSTYNSPTHLNPPQTIILTTSNPPLRRHLPRRPLLRIPYPRPPLRNHNSLPSTLLVPIRLIQRDPGMPLYPLLRRQFHRSHLNIARGKSRQAVSFLLELLRGQARAVFTISS
jgi:hypothetical protein